MKKKWKFHIWSVGSQNRVKKDYQTTWSRSDQDTRSSYVFVICTIFDKLYGTCSKKEITVIHSCRIAGKCYQKTPTDKNISCPQHSSEIRNYDNIKNTWKNTGVGKNRLAYYITRSLVLFFYRDRRVERHSNMYQPLGISDV